MNAAKRRRRRHERRSETGVALACARRMFMSQGWNYVSRTELSGPYGEVMKLRAVGWNVTASLIPVAYARHISARIGFQDDLVDSLKYALASIGRGDG